MAEEAVPASDPPSMEQDEAPPGNPYADESEWGEDITADKNGGLFKRILTEGAGTERPMADDRVFVHYTGRLLDGTKFDSSVDRGEKFKFTLGQGSVIKGWDEGVATMRKGEKALLTCKADYAYGEKGSGDKIPPNSTLQFEVELFSWEGEDITNDGGVIMNIIEQGDKSDYYRPKDGTEVEVALVGSYDGKEFDNRTVKFPVGEGSEYNVIEGIERGIKKMRRMQKARLQIKPSYSWGPDGNEEMGVPPDVTVVYLVTLLSYAKLKESWEYDEIEDRKKDAGSLKEKGNSYFKEKKYSLALKLYQRAADLVSETAIQKDEEKEAIAQVFVAVELNIAAVQLQQRVYSSAKESCDKVLQREKENTKALYRRGQAHFGLQDFDQAIKDFEEVIRIEPGNKAAQNRIAECHFKVKANKERERRMYQNMFSGLGKGEAATPKADDTSAATADDKKEKTDATEEQTDVQTETMEVKEETADVKED